MNKARLESLFSGVLTIAAVAVAVVIVARELKARRAEAFMPRQTTAQSAKYIQVLDPPPSFGHMVGGPTARVRLVEFFDLQCPACRRYNETVLDKVLQRLGQSVAVTFVHLPLSIHRFAPIAAKAAECAERGARFREFVEYAYAAQDSFGLKAWSEYASAAGIVDTNRFVRCVASRETVPSIDSGIALAGRLKITATPTLAINGWLYSRPPSEDDLMAAANKILAGNEPFTRKP